MQTNGDGVYNAWHFSANIEIVVEIYRSVALGPKIKKSSSLAVMIAISGFLLQLCGIDINGNRLTDLTNMDIVVGIMSCNSIYRVYNMLLLK